MGSLASAPGPDVAVPDAMSAVATGPVSLVWLNEAGGLTGRVDGREPRFIKWNPAGSGESLADEADRLAWLAGRHPVPAVIDYRIIDGDELLVTRALDGRSAVDPAWKEHPDDAVRAIAEGLRLLHSLPVDECPFEWSAERRAVGSMVRGAAPAIDRFVVCHGDPCAPNTLMADDGSFSANVDFGRLGVADRWADLAVATMSLQWNFDTFDESIFWETYGIQPDDVRIEYYRELWSAE
jgi:kanamycin kinase